MPAEIGAYNANFTRFVTFAQEQATAMSKTAARDSKAVARLASDGAVTPLFARNVSATTTDKVGSWWRSGTEKTANDQVRTAFRAAVAEMFGGEEHIPQSVLDAMRIKDYGKGRPLTARRIMEVKVAVDAAKGQWAAAPAASVNVPDLVHRYGRNIGFDPTPYTDAEIADINRAASFLAESESLDVVAALMEVTREGSQANRLMQYGGAFMKSAATFSAGLKLLDDYHDWFSNVSREVEDRDGGSLAERDSKCTTATSRNMCGWLKDEKVGQTLERFVFEDLAMHPERIRGTADETFGMQNNPVTRFFGRDSGKNLAGTYLALPVAKRTTVMAAFDAVMPFYAGRIQDRPKDAHETMLGADMLLARILLKFDEVQLLHETGRLTGESLVKTLYPDLQTSRKVSPGELLDRFYKAESFGQGVDVPDTDAEKMAAVATMIGRIHTTGHTLKELLEAQENGVRVPDLPEYVPVESSMASFDGTTDGALEQIRADLFRPSSLADLTTNQRVDGKFAFTFPGKAREEMPITNDNAVRARESKRIHDQILDLCVNKKQAVMAMFMVSQAGLARMRMEMLPHKIDSNEHTALDFTLSRAPNGDVTILYHSPAEFDRGFHWTTTISKEGQMTISDTVFD